MRDIHCYIPGIIPGGVSVADFAAAAGIDRAAAKAVLCDLVRHGIGSTDGRVFDFSEADRLRAAILALERGAAIDAVAEKLGWRDFEGLAAQILGEKGFATMRNLVLKKPRMEIDVVGIKHGVAMLIDCKHWRKNSDSALRTMVQKQIQRTRHYVDSTPGAVAAPVIVTLYRDAVGFIDGVPIVPIFQFSSFVDEFYGNMDGMRTIKKD